MLVYFKFKVCKPWFKHLHNFNSWLYLVNYHHVYKKFSPTSLWTCITYSHTNKIPTIQCPFSQTIQPSKTRFNCKGLKTPKSKILFTQKHWVHISSITLVSLETSYLIHTTSHNPTYSLKKRQWNLCERTFHFLKYNLVISIDAKLAIIELMHNIWKKIKTTIFSEYV